MGAGGWSLTVDATADRGRSAFASLFATFATACASSRMRVISDMLCLCGAGCRAGRGATARTRGGRCCGGDEAPRPSLRPPRDLLHAARRRSARRQRCAAASRLAPGPVPAGSQRRGGIVRDASSGSPGQRRRRAGVAARAGVARRPISRRAARDRSQPPSEAQRAALGARIASSRCSARRARRARPRSAAVISSARRSSSLSRALKRARCAAADALGRRGLLGLGQLALDALQRAPAPGLALARAQAPAQPLDLRARLAFDLDAAVFGLDAQALLGVLALGGALQLAARAGDEPAHRAPRRRARSRRSFGVGDRRSAGSPARPRAGAAAGSRRVSRASAPSPRRPPRAASARARPIRPRVARGVRPADRPRCGARGPSSRAATRAVAARRLVALGDHDDRKLRRQPDGSRRRSRRGQLSARRRRARLARRSAASAAAARAREAVCERSCHSPPRQTAQPSSL